MTTVDFKPSDVDLMGSFPPLVATFDKTEVECAAFYVVRTLVAREDEWRAVRWSEISEVAKSSMRSCEMLGDEAPVLDRRTKDLVINPFARPDFHRLAEGGFARWLGEEGEKNRPLELTDQGLERLRKWVKKKAAS
jgi:hypothetical protein